MTSNESRRSRRQFLARSSVVSLIGLAGCIGEGEGEEQQVTRDSDWCIEELDVEVPEAERRAESIDGIQRDPDDLEAREDVAYQCHPQGYQLCANCQYFIPGTTSDSIGACAIVAGRVRSQDWCALYEETERLDRRPDADPDGPPGHEDDEHEH